MPTDPTTCRGKGRAQDGRCRGVRKQQFVEGWPVRKLVRRLQIARQTVRKELQSAKPPLYKLRKGRPCPAMDAYRQVIQAWLAADEAAPPKQRHTAKRIYDRLVEEFGFTGRESTVLRFVRQLRGKKPEVFIPLEPDDGEVAQVDWGQATVVIAGVPTVVHQFILRLSRSGVVLAWADPDREDQGVPRGTCPPI